MDSRRLHQLEFMASPCRVIMSTRFMPHPGVYPLDSCRALLYPTRLLSIEQTLQLVA